MRRSSTLAHYADDGCYLIDNNSIGNAIRPIVLGRKIQLIAGAESAGRRAAAPMILLAIVKADGHEPQAWLIEVLILLLPHRWKAVV